MRRRSDRPPSTPETETLDPLGRDAEYVAADLGVSVDEARAYLERESLIGERGEAASTPSVAICSFLDERNGDFRVLNYRYVNELDDASYGPADIDAPRLHLR